MSELLKKVIQKHNNGDRKIFLLLFKKRKDCFMILIEVICIYDKK